MSFTFSSPVIPMLTSSSPLNPYRNSGDRSSSPVTSPTPFSRTNYQLPFTCRASASSSSSSDSYRLHQPKPTRYTRPLILSRRTSQKPINGQGSSPSHGGGIAADLFSEGTTPTEGAMWRERFSRRMEERERRKRTREADLDRRRAVANSLEDEEADRKAQADDEEIFRRLMVLQRRKANHAQLVSHEIETGGSDPNLPEFWEDELNHLEDEERALISAMEEEDRLDQIRNRPALPQSQTLENNANRRVRHQELLLSTPNSPILEDEIEDEEELWAREAAEAEQAERDAEEMEIARQVEEAIAKGGVRNFHGFHPSAPSDIGMEIEMNWEDMRAMDDMDVE